MVNYQGNLANKSKKTRVDKRDVLKWTEHMDEFLLDALLQQQRLGNRIDKVFTTAAYDNMVKELREKMEMPVEKDHLKNRIKTLKRNFRECYDLFKGRSGFVWSPETKMWNAKPEMWKALVKVKLDARKWMTTPIVSYDKMILLFAKEMDDCHGVNAVKEIAGSRASLGDSSLFGIDPQNGATCIVGVVNDMNYATSQLGSPVETDSQVDSGAPSQSATSLKGKKRKAPKIDVFEREFKSIREAIKDVAEAIREGNAIAERGRPQVYSEQEVFAELVNIGFDAELRYKAYTFLIANAGRVRAFFGCPAEERKEFLLQTMTDESGLDDLSFRCG